MNHYKYFLSHFLKHLRLIPDRLVACAKRQTSNMLPSYYHLHARYSKLTYPQRGE
jgi:hypothetical protein